MVSNLDFLCVCVCVLRGLVQGERVKEKQENEMEKKKEDKI